MCKTNRRKNSQHGSTLIELAVVLMVIGLLVGVILKDQELVHNAKQKEMRTYPKGFNSSVPDKGEYQDNYCIIDGRRINLKR